MDVRWAFVTGRDDHGRKSEVATRHSVVVAGHAGTARADIAHLGTAVFGVVVGLKLQGIPVIATGFKTRHARRHPLLERLARLTHHAGLDVGFGGDVGIEQAAFIEHGLIGRSVIL